MKKLALLLLALCLRRRGLGAGEGHFENGRQPARPHHHLGRGGRADQRRVQGGQPRRGDRHGELSGPALPAEDQDLRHGQAAPRRVQVLELLDAAEAPGGRQASCCPSTRPPSRSSATCPARWRPTCTAASSTASRSPATCGSIYYNKKLFRTPGSARPDDHRGPRWPWPRSSRPRGSSRWSRTARTPGRCPSPSTCCHRAGQRRLHPDPEGPGPQGEVHRSRLRRGRPAAAEVRAVRAVPGGPDGLRLRRLAQPLRPGQGGHVPHGHLGDGPGHRTPTSPRSSGPTSTPSSSPCSNPARASSTT